MALSITGLVAGASQSFSALQGIANGALGAPPISLGSFVFKDFEVPEKVEFGGDEMLTVHKLPGGRRIIDVMGGDRKDITWEGTFLGPDAIDRAQQLDTIRSAGKPVSFTMGKVHATVILKELHLTYQRSSHVKYRITLVVAPAAPVANDNVQPGGFLSSIRDAISTVENTVNDAVTSVEQAIGPITAVAAQVGAVVNPLLAGLGVSSPYLTLLTSGIGSINSAGLLAAATSTITNMTALDGLLSQQQSTVITTMAGADASLNAIVANTATSGVIAAAPPALASQAIANAPPATASTSLVWSASDLITARAATATQVLSVNTSAPITNSRRDLLTSGFISTSSYPNLQAVTNDLYAATIPTTTSLIGGQLALILPALVNPVSSHTIVVTVPSRSTGATGSGSAPSTTSGSSTGSGGSTGATGSGSNGGSSYVGAAFSDGTRIVFSSGLALVFSGSTAVTPITPTTPMSSSAIKFSNGSAVTFSDGTPLMFTS